MIDEIKCDLLRTRKHYIRAIEVDKILQGLNNTYCKDFLELENKIIQHEEVLYQLLHRKIQLDSKLESYIRRNMTFSNEYLEVDYDFVATCKKLDNSLIEYKLLLQSLSEATEELKQIKIAV